MSEPDWGAERERLTRRSLAQAGLVFGPLVGIVLTLGAVSDHPTYVPGDPRNEPLYWIVTAVVGVAVAIVVVTLAMHELRRGPGPEPGPSTQAGGRDEAWIRRRVAALRRQDRRRDNARGLLVIGPALAAIAIFSVITGRGIYESGDFRLAPGYEIAVVVGGIALGTAIVIFGLRELRRSRDDP